MPTNRIAAYLPAAAPVPTEFVGWLRCESEWEERVSSATSAGCWALLLGIEAGGRNVDRAVLPRGEHPGRPKAKRR